jgi:branched-chain amino acid transport system substrate-binding protein
VTRQSPLRGSHGVSRRRLRGALVSVGVLAVACGSTSSTSGGGSGGATGTITLGVLADLSGPCQGTGPPIRDGAQIAADKINNAGGVKIGNTTYTVKLDVQDDGSTNTQAVTATNKLIQDDGVKFILGPTCSAFSVQGVAPLTAKNKVMYVNNFPTPDLNDPTKAVAATQQFPYVYLDSPRSVDATPGYGSGIPHFFPNAKKVYYLFDANIKPVVPQEKLYFDALGIEFTGAGFDDSQTDFTGELTTAKAAHPDVLVYGVTQAPSLAILKQALALDVAPAYYTQNGACCDDALKNATGSPINKPWAALAFPNSMDHPTSDTVKQVAAALVKKNGKLGGEDSFAIVGYDQVNLVIQGMVQAGTVDVAAVAHAFDTGTFSLVEGGANVKFDKGHAPTISSQDICKVVNGNVTCENLPIPPPDWKSPPLVGG